MADQDDSKFNRPATKVPSGRLSRFLQISATASRMAAGGVAEKAKRVTQRARKELPHALLTANNARLLAQRLARLRGAAMKVGQMLSMEGDNMLPREFSAALEILRSSAHQMPKEQVRAVLQKELGSDFRQRFATFDLQPLAAASIGQVHAATKKDGRPIVLKIQYPGVAESIDSDVDNLRSLLSLARLLPGELDIDALSAEVKEELHREVDYARELMQLSLYRESVGEKEGLFVPEAHPELSTTRVLAMDHAPGIDLLKWGEDAPQHERDAVAYRLLDLLFCELFEIGLMQTDPNPGNYLYDEASGNLVLLDFGAARSVPPRIQDLYRRALLAMATEDRDILKEVLRDMGVEPKQGSPALEIIISLAMESSEAFRGGLFDFEKTDLSQRLHNRGLELSKHQKDLKSPPPEFIFFQRKLGGTFLLCRQLRARVDCAALLVKYKVTSPTSEQTLTDPTLQAPNHI